MLPVHHEKPEHAWIVSRTSSAGADPRTQPWRLMLGGHRRGRAPAPPRPMMLGGHRRGRAPAPPRPISPAQRW